MKIRYRSFEANELRLKDACTDGLAHLAQNMGWIHRVGSVTDKGARARKYIYEHNPIMTLDDVAKHCRRPEDVVWAISNVRTKEDPHMRFVCYPTEFFARLRGIAANYCPGMYYQVAKTIEYVDTRGRLSLAKEEVLWAMIAEEMLDSESSIEAVSRIEMQLRKICKSKGQEFDSYFPVVPTFFHRKS